MPSLLLPLVPSVAAAVDHAALWVVEEDVLRPKCTEMDARLVVDDTGALVVSHLLKASAEMHGRIGMLKVSAEMHDRTGR